MGPREPELPKRAKILPPELPFTDQEQTFTRMLKKEPLLERLVNNLDLVTEETGEQPRRTDTEAPAPGSDPQAELRNTKPGRTLREIALTILDPLASYTREEVIERIQRGTGVNQERAENGFNLMIGAGEVEEVPGQDIYYQFYQLLIELMKKEVEEVPGQDIYYLRGSSPF